MLLERKDDAKKTADPSPDQPLQINRKYKVLSPLMPLRNWGRVYGELQIMYEGRLPE